MVAATIATVLIVVRQAEFLNDWGNKFGSNLFNI